MEFWRFIFSSFWVWLGFIILISLVGGGVVELVKACKRNRRISGYRVGDRWSLDVENASTEDAQHAILSMAYGQEKGGEAEHEQELLGNCGTCAGGQIQNQ